MEKFNVEVYDFPRQEIEAENAEKAARKYFSEHQMAEQMIKKCIRDEYVSVIDGKRHETEFIAALDDVSREFDFIKLSAS